MAGNVIQMLFRKSVKQPTETEVDTETPASFGLDPSTVDARFDAHALISSPRVMELQYRSAFYSCRVHDWKMFDFNGRVISGGRVAGTQPMISSSAPSFYVPLDQRRPSTPYRLPRKIVDSFTSMLFSHGRWPQMRSEDPATQDFAEALVQAAGIQAKFIRGRTIGGRCGTVGFSWAFVDGLPRVRVHIGSHVHVLEWEDEDERIPAHVVELYQVPIPANQRHPKGPTLMWRRRDWTPTADIVFRPAPVDSKTPAVWIIDEEQSCIHGDRFCHFVWIENLPDDENPGEFDGVPDYAEAYEPLISLDLLNSVNVKGATLNLDPTLKLKMDPEALRNSVVKKGSEQAIITGFNGDASYLELSGTSIAAGTALVEALRAQILETVECVVLDPDKATAAGSSSVALHLVYAPTLAKTGILREQYGVGLMRLLDQMITSARRLLKPTVEVKTDEEGNQIEEPIEVVLNLPPRIEISIDPSTQQQVITQHARDPGSGRVWPEWGPYFKPTTADYQQAAGALSSATGGKAVLSQQTGAELCANIWDRDGTTEWTRLSAEQAAAAASAANGMFPPAGGPVNGPPDLSSQDTPPELEAPQEGAQATPPPDTEGLATPITLAPTDLGKIVTVNEARRGQGLGPLLLPGKNIPDPDGYLTIAEFSAKREALADANASIAEANATATPAPSNPPAAPPTPPVTP